MSEEVTFDSRWLIRGRLILESPLALRTGDAQERELPGADEEDASPDVALVHRTADGRPMIPGSSLKGVLRHWLAARLPGDEKAVNETLKPLFGHKPEPIKDGSDVQASTGGKAEIHDSIAAWALTTGPRDDAPPPLPLRTSTAINPDTRTAERRKLFHGEQVPAGTTFCVEITGDNLSDDEVALLLAAMEGFNADGDDLAATLGGGGSSGKGRATWHFDGVRRMNPMAVALWLREPAPRSWRQAIVENPLCRENATAWRARAMSLSADLQSSFVRLEVELHFDGPFLVKDPQRQDPDADRRDDDEKSAKPSLPRLDERGLPLLPGESVKGALRAQASRICRTIGVPDTTVATLFGDTKHRAMLDVDDFRRVDARGLGRQQFVAIDRFTGGAAPGKLYLFKHADRPVMRGALTLGLKRRNTAIRPRDVGLLALTLRDLVEGDITFGLGAAKGYGACTARIVGCIVRGRLPEALEDLPGVGAVRAADWPVVGAKTNYGEMLNECVRALHEQKPAEEEAESGSEASAAGFGAGEAAASASAGSGSDAEGAGDDG